MTAPQAPLRPGDQTPAGGGTPAALEGFAAAGGLSESLAMLGIRGVTGIDLNADACAVAEAAGHPREQADIRSLDPAAHPGVETWIGGPPCQTFSRGGLGSGVAELAQVLRGVEAVSDSKEPGDFTDPRTGLVLEALRFALDLPDVQVVIFEQVPDVRPIWAEMAAELAAFHRFSSVDVITVAADDLGLPTRRTRVFLIACRDHEPDLSGLPYRARLSSGRFVPDGFTEHPPNTGHQFPRLTMAEALGWPAGVRVNTRGNRRTQGGNEFSADGPAPSLTGRARTWYRTDLGPTAGRLTPAQAGLIQGFPADYPWHAASSRTSAFQRIADSVCPMVGAAVVGAALGVPWEGAVGGRLAALYGPSAGTVAPVQLDLLAEAAG